MDTKERIKKLANILRSRRAKAAEDKKEKEDKEEKSKSKKTSSLSALKAKTAEARKVLDTLRNKKFAGTKKVAIDSVTEDGTNDIDDASSMRDYKNSEPGEIAGDNATGADLDRLKKEQLDTAPPTLLAEDVRAAYKRALKLAFMRFTKNLDVKDHEIKAALYDMLEPLAKSSKIKEPIIIAAIEAAFEKSSSKFLEELFKRADEISKFSDEAITDMESTIEMTVTLDPDEGTVEGEFEPVEEEEKEEGEEDIEARLKEGSFAMPKVASVRDSLLTQAMPKYSFSK